MILKELDLGAIFLSGCEVAKERTVLDPYRGPLNYPLEA